MISLQYELLWGQLGLCRHLYCICFSFKIPWCEYAYGHVIIVHLVHWYKYLRKERVSEPVLYRASLWIWTIESLYLPHLLSFLAFLLTESVVWNLVRSFEAGYLHFVCICCLVPGCFDIISWSYVLRLYVHTTYINLAPWQYEVECCLMPQGSLWFHALHFCFCFFVTGLCHKIVHVDDNSFIDILPLCEMTGTGVILGSSTPLSQS